MRQRYLYGNRFVDPLSVNQQALEDDVQLASRTTDRMLKEDSDDEVATDEAEKIVQNLSTNSDSQTSG